MCFVFCVAHLTETFLLPLGKSLLIVLRLANVACRKVFVVLSLGVKPIM